MPAICSSREHSSAHISLLFVVISNDELIEPTSYGREESPMKQTESLPFGASGSLPEQNSLVELGAVGR